MIVRLCGTQIGENPPILTKKLTKTKTKKSVKKSADFVGLEKSVDFFVCVEIVWWDTSFSPTKRFPHRLERLKYTKSGHTIGHTIGHKIGHKIGHCFPGSRSKDIDLGVTQPDFQRV